MDVASWAILVGGELHAIGEAERPLSGDAIQRLEKSESVCGHGAVRWETSAMPFNFVIALPHMGIRNQESNGGMTRLYRML
ncbi:hypothetical protein [Phreatobacter sp. AB_2022a]|uniref:hypothetical protein n=1 Tax=Phreatobacter sp. AB_2022a TaxID=3003134 RepID=UPI00228724F2|nr:hypothetical protein [Phreatobacter sp. AB_2022a]MCZ0737084.1 hypothetical protein [Phreatobacter sp. AB_2022a]